MTRIFERVIKGSHTTDSISKGNLTPEEYHAAVTISLESYKAGDSRIDDYIKLRLSSLKH